ncbi:MAG: hypothetical protein Q9162_005729 [Coniocarpon cinnabarinum]
MVLAIAVLTTAQNVVKITPNATVAQAGRSISQIINPAFAGFGIEPSNLISYTGAEEANALSLNLLYTLANYTGVPPHFRIGGNTQDNMVYVEDYGQYYLATNPTPQGNGQVPWDLYTFGPLYLEALDRFPPGTPITYGLSLAYDFANWTEQIVARANATQSLLKQTKLASFEIGNEVNLYLQNEFRNGSWGGQVYSREWLQRADAVFQNVLKPANIQPNFFEPGCTSSTIGTTFEISQLANQYGITAPPNGTGNNSQTFVSAWNQHDYYYYLGISDYNLILDQLMSLRTVPDQFQAWADQVQEALETRFPYVLREYASVGPTGEKGISDTFGATLWTLNSMLYFATLNISSVQYHMTDDSYAAAWQPLDREDAPAHVRSSFYAFAAMNQIIGPQCSTQIQAMPVNDPPGGYADRLGAYASYKQGDLASMILLNTKMSNSSAPSRGSVTWNLDLPLLSGQTLYLSYLSAAGADAVYNTTWNAMNYEQNGIGLPTTMYQAVPTAVVGPDGATTVSLRDSEAVVVNVGHQIGVGERYNQTACQELASRQPVPLPDAVNDDGSPEHDSLQHFISIQTTAPYPTSVLQYTTPAVATSKTSDHKHYVWRASGNLVGSSRCAMSQSNFLDRAIGTVKKAVEADTSGDYETAYNFYHQGVELFLLVLKYEKNPRQKEMLRNKTKEYLDRAEKLRDHLANQDAGNKKKPAAMGTNGKSSGGGGEGKDDDEDADAKKLRGALAGAILSDKPNVKWEDVAGLELAKESLKEAVILPIKFPHLFTGKRQPWKGILLYGPPGTGKSYLAKAVATEANSTFFSVSSSDLVSKWMGESERLVKQLFNMARENKPSIIFIDEIDALCGPRGEGESEASRRIKTELLVQMDGVGKDSKGVLILGATNIPWQLDAAIRRRFQRRVHINLPDTPARMKMFEISVGSTPCELKQSDYKKLAEMSEGYSGSDISIAVQDALMQPVRKIQTATHYKKVLVEGVEKLTPCSPGDAGAVEMNWTEVDSDKLQEPPLIVKDFIKAIKGARPTVSQADLERNADWTKEFGSEGS